MKKPNHERIYLIPGSYDGENCYVWSDDPAPGTEDNPQDAIEYVRADLFKALQAQVDDINRKCSDLIAERDAAFFASRKSAELHAKVQFAPGRGLNRERVMVKVAVDGIGDRQFVDGARRGGSQDPAATGFRVCGRGRGLRAADRPCRASRRIRARDRRARPWSGRRALPAGR